MKIVQIFKSWRFWVIVFIAVVEKLQAENVFDTGTFAVILNILEYVGGGAATVRTIDRFGEKAGAKKEPTV